MADGAATSLIPRNVIERSRGLAYPVGAMALILVILIPLPTWLMDVLLVTNITLSVLLYVYFYKGWIDRSG